METCTSQKHQDMLGAKTSAGEPRGYIDFQALKQLWIHTGTLCNLACPNCFEHSGPKSKRLGAISLEDIRPYLKEAAALNVSSFGFTGGEPFMNPHIMPMLTYALTLAPCLVLTNATKPLAHYLPELKSLLNSPYPLSFRVSLDAPDKQLHDAQRGIGSFELALKNLKALHDTGFSTAVAYHIVANENHADVAQQFKELFHHHGLPENMKVVGFPDLERKETPEISENCIRTYHTPQSCAGFMCASSRMLTKVNNDVRIYACTLVDDNPAYDYGNELSHSLKQRTLLAHRRCFACFSSGVACGQA